MGMITPWDSLGMGSKLHVATDIEVILSVSLLGRNRRPASSTTLNLVRDTHPRHIHITDDLLHGHDNTLGQSWDG